MDRRNDLNDSTDGRIERAKEAALGSHRGEPSVGDEVGEAVGGIGGVLVGAGIGSAGGPIGTLIGGIAGAIGGWWSGRAVSEATEKLTRDDDEFYRAHYQSSPSALADRRFEDVRPAYYLGHVAAYNPDYANRSWREVEAELSRGWTNEHATRYGDWATMSGFASAGFDRGRSTLDRVSGRTGATTSTAPTGTGRTREDDTLDRR